MRLRLSAVLVALLTIATSTFAQKNYGNGLQEYTLENGLTVYLWEDASQPDVHGRIVTRAGSLDEPADYTGLAHYLEHVLFKGTDKIGALDWEKEAPLYQDIIKLYDELVATTDEAKRKELIAAINEKSLEAAKYGATDEFSNLTESYGGDGLNAFTSYDMTAYFNDFPASAMEKWLELNSERLMNPVFRAFQAELENVFEEYNMYQDDYSTHMRDFLFENLYKGTPYERSVIGTPEHLKNPSLSALINFFQTWYVPNNMSLILVGNFDAEAAKPMIEAKFGRLKAKELPARTQITDTDFSGNKKHSIKVGYYPTVMWTYPGIKVGDNDELAVEFMTQMLNNGHSTGLLDRLMLENIVSQAFAYPDNRRLTGRIMVQAIPYYDISQRKYESERTTERIVFNEIDKLKNGTAPEWLFNSVKNQMLQSYKTMFESNNAKVNALTNAYAYGEDVEEYLKRNAAIQAITMDDVKRVANKYFDNSKQMIFSVNEGEPKKNKLAKPSIKPLDTPKGEDSPYALAFKQIPETPVVMAYNNFADVVEMPLYNGVDLFWTENNKNDVFNLTLRFGVGTKEMPKLEYAASLLNSAGMMPNIKAQDLRRQFSELGAACSFSADDNYFYINVSGDDKNLEEICRLMTAQALMPLLDDQQVKSTVTGTYFSRFSEKRNPNILASAVMEYIIYGNNSRYIDRIPMEELYKYSIVDGTVIESFLVNKTNLTTTIQEATDYEVDIHYCGTKPVKEVAEIMKANTPIKQNIKRSNSPQLRNRQTYDKTEVYFLPDSKVQQAKVYFYVNGKPYAISEDVNYDAFNQYFSGGFSGLVMNEIREKRSMAYTAYGNLSTPILPGKDAYLIGYVGTQNDKVADAIDVYMDLLNNMPDHPERVDNIKTFLRQSALSSKPGMRSKSRVYEYWKQLGYKEDPAKVNMNNINNLTYDQIKSFYEANIKGQPVTVVVIGDPKTINMKQIQSKYGKVKKVSPGKLFKGGI